MDPSGYYISSIEFDNLSKYDDVLSSSQLDDLRTTKDKRKTR
jgi:hypothetical protein